MPLRSAAYMWFVLSVLVVFGTVTPSPALADRVQGAGSTFAFPVIRAWARSFLEARADGTDFVVDDLGVDYEPVGSLAGIMRLAQPELDFAASDAPLSPLELDKRGLAQFPLVIGGLAVVFNLDGVETGALKLTGDLLAKMYLGQITRWSDPAITAANPGIALPDVAVHVVHRSDGSGSTLTFTRYLSDSNADWNTGPGSDTLLAWPTGAGAEGTSGIIEAVRGTTGAIGYVEHGQAVREGLAVLRPSNRSGAFIAPGLEIFQATAAMANWDPASGFYLQLADIDAPDAYPLAAITFALMHKTGRSEARTRRTLFFLAHALDEGGPQARALGYVPLPEALVDRIKTYWHEVLPGAAGL